MRMPETIKDIFGYALYLAQTGDHHPEARRMKGLGATWEIRADCRANTYRAVYCIEFSDAVYVLHVFKKKSHQGRKTPREDKGLIATRLKNARTHYQTREN